MYAVSLGIGGVALFFVLMRLFASDWEEVVDSLVSILKPNWEVDHTENQWKALKVFGVALLAAYLIIVFHWKRGDWWAGFIGVQPAQ